MARMTLQGEHERGALQWRVLGQRTQHSARSNGAATLPPTQDPKTNARLERTKRASRIWWRRRESNRGQAANGSGRGRWILRGVGPVRPRGQPPHWPREAARGGGGCTGAARWRPFGWPPTSACAAPNTELLVRPTARPPPPYGASWYGRPPLTPARHPADIARRVGVYVGAEFPVDSSSGRLRPATHHHGRAALG